MTMLEEPAVALCAAADHVARPCAMAEHEIGTSIRLFAMRWSGSALESFLLHLGYRPIRCIRTLADHAQV